VRKPLIIFTPKSLLRHPRAVSPLNEFTAGTFREVLADDDAIRPDRVTRVLLCSGKIYYELLEAREKRQAGSVALIRLEQLYPFPAESVRDALLRYPSSAEIFWVQEEPRNMGAWRFVQENMQSLLADPRRELRYAGRAASASTAAGSLKRHLEEQAEVIDQAFALQPAVPKRRLLVSRGK